MFPISGFIEGSMQKDRQHICVDVSPCWLMQFGQNAAGDLTGSQMAMRRGGAGGGVPKIPFKVKNKSTGVTPAMSKMIHR